MNKFIAEVKKERGKKITAPAADELIARTHKVRQKLWEEIDRYRDD